MNPENPIIKEYKLKGEDFNVTSSDDDAIYIKDFTDEQLLSEYNNICSTEKLHWWEEWVFIFGDAILKRRIKKINKIKEIIYEKSKSRCSNIIKKR